MKQLIEFHNTAGFLLMTKFYDGIAFEISLSKGKLNLYEQMHGNARYNITPFDSFDELLKYFNRKHPNNNLADFRELAERRLISHKESYIKTQKMKEKMAAGR
jgi:hypothetical protein